MSSFAIFVIIVVIVAALWGWKAGLLKQAGQIAGILLGIVVCRIFGPGCIDWLCSADTGATDRTLYTILIYIVVFIATYSAAMAVAYMMRNILYAVHLGFINAMGGAVFRVTEWIFILSMLLNLWESISPVSALATDPVYVRVLWFGPWLLNTEAALQIGHAVTGALGA